MNQKLRQIYIGDTPQQRDEKNVMGEYVVLNGDVFYKIHHYDAMRPFFMSLVSSSNHWLFISSTGGLSAGRVSAEQSLFPYYTDDKLAENSENTGNKTILLVAQGQRTRLWEPFSDRQQNVYTIERNLYKNVAGSTILFEERNLDLGLAYRYAWRTSDAYGFVKSSWLINLGQAACEVELLDGLQNILPANITSTTQNTFSVLLDAYKRSELDSGTGLAIFALNSILTDLAEPSESLLATTVFHLGLDQADCLLSSWQLDRFRGGEGVTEESEVRGRRCAYFVHSALRLEPGEERQWSLVADVNQDSAAIVRLSKMLRENPAALAEDLERDIEAGAAYLEKIVASADGLQVSNHKIHCDHHFANVMFNAMRGGVFSNQYAVRKQDFIEFVTVRDREATHAHAAFFSALPEQLDISDLQARAEASGVQALVRLSYAFLPLSFSRRHGDPSRPWNRFAINLKNRDGSLRLDYEGNWRDIFQNWEALAYSFPEYIESMVSTFLNATTPDGYNPYRITYRGIDWEVPEPNNPWANIGYWSDHQIIYLQKLMEISARVHPGRLQAFLARPLFSYANVPYRIKRYADLQKDPYNSIDFNWDLEKEIEQRVRERGTDGKLVYAQRAGVLQASLAEKLLTLLLAKLVNFVPEGGIWMNTQRPEWNDANNALVGKGLSVVTLCYLRRTIVFFKELLLASRLDTLEMTAEVVDFFSQISRILQQFGGALRATFGDEQRRAVMDALGQAGSDYRWNYYSQGFSGKLAHLPSADVLAFLDTALGYVEHTLRANQRSDKLYHAYNILNFYDHKASVSHLYEMLEGQVAVLSSGMLTGEESLALLESMRRGPLYRADQHSYILYPDRPLTKFLEKNRLSAEQVKGLALVGKLVEAQDHTLINRDVEGNYHFSGGIRNLKDVDRALEALQRQPAFAALVKAEGAKMDALFESVFHHDQFTGRSGTFFAYEGLGSIYWHMVSKLLLAVEETILRTQDEPSTAALIERYVDIRKGQCFNKSPEEYGAFPTDPYSHTPKGQGAKQPGMTGMVKEEILARQTELGLSVDDGRLVFDFMLLDRDEFLTTATPFAYWDVHGRRREIQLEAGALGYTICQVPVILQRSAEDCIKVFGSDGGTRTIAGLSLDAADSRHIFLRDGSIDRLVICVSG